MSTTGVRRDDTNGIASVKDVDLKLEVVDPAPRMSIARRSSTGASGGGWTGLPVR
jgi:hypothetical protein